MKNPVSASFCAAASSSARVAIWPLRKPDAAITAGAARLSFPATLISITGCCARAASGPLRKPDGAIRAPPASLSFPATLISITGCCARAAGISMSATATCRRVGQRVGPHDVLRPMADLDLDAPSAQALHRLRGLDVAAGGVMAHACEHGCDRAHARSE